MAEPGESMYNLTHDSSGLVWVAHTGTEAVPDAVYAGKETNDREMYVARAMDRCSLRVGKFVPGFGMSYANDYEEVKPATFQVLTNPNEVQTKWALFEGKIPPTAVRSGFFYFADSGKSWEYIGRTKHSGHTVLGYLFSENLRLSYYMNGDDHSSDDFEILLAKNPHEYQCLMNYQLNCCKSCPKKKQ